MPRQIKLLYFAWLRERIGQAEEDLEVPATVADVGALIGWLRHRSPGHNAAFATTAVIRCAINQDFAGPDTVFANGDEIAFFPPVTGG